MYIRLLFSLWKYRKVTLLNWIWRSALLRCTRMKPDYDLERWLVSNILILMALNFIHYLHISIFNSNENFKICFIYWKSEQNYIFQFVRLNYNMRRIIVHAFNSRKYLEIFALLPWWFQGHIQSDNIEWKKVTSYNNLLVDPALSASHFFSGLEIIFNNWKKKLNVRLILLLSVYCRKL